MRQVVAVEDVGAGVIRESEEDFHHAIVPQYDRVSLGIAVAFIATFYGIGFANLILLPLANHIKYVNQQNNVKRQIVIAGLLTIQRGDNPRIVKDRLLVIVPDEEVKKSINEEYKG